MDSRRRNVRAAIARSLLIVTAVAAVSNNHGGAILVSAFIAPSRGHSLPQFPEARYVVKVSTTSATAATARRCRYGSASCRWATMPKQASTPTTTTSEEGSNFGSVPSPVKRTNSSKLRQLKDRMWVRETLEDITAAEFASSLSVEMEEDDQHNDVSSSSNSNNNGRFNNNGELSSMKNNSNGANNKLSPPPRRKRAVDFDNVLKKLDSRIEAMCIITTPESAQRLNRTCHIIDRRVFGSEDGGGEEGGNAYIENACYSLDENVGLGSVVYTPQQREALLSRLISTRMRLVNFIKGSTSDGSGGGGGDEGEGEEESIDDIRSQLFPMGGPTTSSDLVKSTTADTSLSKSAAASFDPSLYVREDGTVDWDGALQDREALKKFGSAVWSRINGQDPEEANENDRNENRLMSPKSGGGEGDGGGGLYHSPMKAVTAKIEETDAIREKREQLNMLMSELQQMEVEHIKLLNSAISAGQAVANVNLATVDASLRRRIRESSEILEMKKAQVTFQTLNYELERIYTYLEGELGNTAAKGYIPLQDRLNVAEFGLLESQLDSFTRQIELGESLDSDVLSVVADQLVDFKRRLGIDYYVTGLTFDMEAIQVWMKDIWVKTKNGFAFYVKGTRLFYDDVVFCTSLILRALQGYTLKPREVRTLRRTFKDTITFIPVVIILLIPLSPIGHVLVFGAIQRVFPDFFPSCFTERRQNLLELYESTEYSAVTIDETWQQQLIRLSKAIRILVIGLITKLITSLGGRDLVAKPDESNDS